MKIIKFAVLLSIKVNTLKLYYWYSLYTIEQNEYIRENHLRDINIKAFLELNLVEDFDVSRQILWEYQIKRVSLRFTVGLPKLERHPW